MFSTEIIADIIRPAHPTAERLVYRSQITRPSSIQRALRFRQWLPTPSLMADSFAARGRSLLDKAWQIALESQGDFVTSRDLSAAADKVFSGSEAGYRKAIVIQAAGKAADPGLDAQAMQKGAGLERSWDAREFAKSAFVPWNRSAGEPFSHAADPYVSHPYRVPRFDSSVRGQRQKPLEFDAALDVLEQLETASDEAQAFENLVEVLYALRRFIAHRTVSYPLPNRASLTDTEACVGRFVTPKSGGARLQAIVYALFRALKSQGMSYSNITSRHVNASDTSSQSAGDISLEVDGIKFAMEVKDRPLSRAEFDAAIEKCRVAQIRELLFVVRANNLLETSFTDAEFDFESGRQFSSGLNIYIESFGALARTVLSLIGENGRRAFLEAVGQALSEQNADITHRWDWAAQVKAI